MVKGYKAKLRKAIDNLDKVVTELKDALLIKDSDELLNDISDLSKHAKALARVGASKGGIARAKSLTPERRRIIAKHAAMVRWAKDSDDVLPKEERESIERGLNDAEQGKITRLHIGGL